MLFGFGHMEFAYNHSDWYATFEYGSFHNQ